MILCLGPTPTVQRTLVFDRLALGEVNRAATCDEFASGKGVNVARVAALLGADVVAAGFVGGPRGKLLLDGVKADGIRTAFIKVEPETRLCTTVIDRASGTVTELVEESAVVDPGDYAELFRACLRVIKGGGAKFPNPARVCVLSGSLTPDGDLELYPDVIDYVTRLGGRAVLDTRGKALEHALRCDGFVVKLNRQELSETVGQPLGTDDRLKKAMREACPKDGGSVLVTMGGDGAVAWDGERFWRIPAPKVKAVNPIGSGDAFAAGLAVALSRDLPPAEAYALASACGAANALHPRAGYVDPKEVERLRTAVRVEAW